VRAREVVENRAIASAYRLWYAGLPPPRGGTWPPRNAVPARRRAR